MLNEKKIKYMTKAAAYETGAEKKNIEICNFYRTDYLGLQMLKSAAAYTVSFALLAFLWAVGRMEELMNGISRTDYFGNLLKIAAALYIAGLLLYEIAVYWYFSWKYQKAKECAAKYNRHLKHIREFYETQESVESPVVAKEKTDEEKTL